MKAAVIDKNGKEVENIELNENIFGSSYNNHIIFESIICENANKRQGTHCTKTRSEVHGSGKKPWRQKGTGRARSGSKKSPVWKGGGVAFGPKPRDYSYKLPKKMKRRAYNSLLSDRLKNGILQIVENAEIKEGKTKEAFNFLKSLNYENSKVVYIYKEDNELLKRAFRNIPRVVTLSYKRMNVHDLFYAEKILIEKDAANALNEFLGK